MRLAVAEFGRDEYLDILVHDRSADVRRTVAMFGRKKDLEILANDTSSYVRAIVAKKFATDASA